MNKVAKVLFLAGGVAMLAWYSYDNYQFSKAYAQWLQRGPNLAKRVHVYELQGVEKFAQPRLYRNYPTSESTELRWQR